MNTESGSSLCALTCWGLAALVSAMTTVLLWVLGGWSFMQGAFMGVVAFAVLGLLVSWIACRPLPPIQQAGAVASAAPQPQAAPAPTATAAPAAPAAPEPVAAVEAAEADRPAGLEAVREGGPDDLKKIKGVGPKLEALLHSMGYFHFDQIAAWTARELAWVDANLEGFKGRVTRDDLVAQAKILAGGGETEFSARQDK